MYHDDDLVWWRPDNQSQFTVRGVIETRGQYNDVTGTYDDSKYGVRLENGNFRWSSAAQLKAR